ncbi:MAG: transporter [Noviherbaspirillum sp.]|nr:transporter [Noviherbaspirillum sp.]
MNASSKMALAATIALATVSLAFAQHADYGAHNASSQVAQTPADSAQQGNGVAGQMVEGEVRKVDKDAGKITIRHGELKGLDMPAMTMVFRAENPAMLDQVKAGDRVLFVAEKVGGQFTVTQLQAKQ